MLPSHSEQLEHSTKSKRCFVKLVQYAISFKSRELEGDQLHFLHVRIEFAKSVAMIRSAVFAHALLESMLPAGNNYKDVRASVAI